MISANYPQKRKKLNVVRGTFEKVCRLQEILRFIDSSDLLRSSFALKGGIAINEINVIIKEKNGGMQHPAISV